MIKINIKRKNKQIIYFKINGHANFGEYGEDIVCASVSSVSQMTLNGLIEILKLNNLKYDIKEGLIVCDLENSNLKLEQYEKANILLESMYSYLKAVADNYPKNVKLIIEEV